MLVKALCAPRLGQTWHLTLQLPLTDGSSLTSLKSIFPYFQTGRISVLAPSVVCEVGPQTPKELTLPELCLQAPRKHRERCICSLDSRDNTDYPHLIKAEPALRGVNDRLRKRASEGLSRVHSRWEGAGRRFPLFSSNVKEVWTADESWTLSVHSVL